MNKDFNIVMAYTGSYFNCVHKRSRLNNSDSIETKIKALNISRIEYKQPDKKLKDAITGPDKYDKKTERFNLTLQSVQETLSEQYPDMPTEGLIFNYNGRRVKCICSFNLPDAPVTTIEKIPTEKLNTSVDYIGMAAFYMEVPILE